MKRGNTSVPGDRGAILIIALLLMLVLTGIGLVAAQTASNDLNLAGNARIAQVARNIATSGAEGTMAFAGMNPSGFTQFVTAKDGVVEMGDLTGTFFDPASDGTGSFARDAVSMNTAFWRSRMQAALTTNRAPGFQLGEYCFRRYITLTDGVYRNDLPPATPNALSLTMDRNAQARTMTALFVGPVACP